MTATSPSPRNHARQIFFSISIFQKTAENVYLGVLRGEGSRGTKPNFQSKGQKCD